MDSLVFKKTRTLLESLPTMRAFVRFLSRVVSLMPSKARFVTEGVPTV